MPPAKEINIDERFCEEMGGQISALTMGFLIQSELRLENTNNSGDSYALNSSSITLKKIQRINGAFPRYWGFIILFCKLFCKKLNDHR
jgi:hypothetical protein